MKKTEADQMAKEEIQWRSEVLMRLDQMCWYLRKLAERTEETTPLPRWMPK